MCEENIETLLNCKFIKTEFVVENFRFDSLCFDQQNSSFVIVEYKRDKNFSVIDQGYAYLSTMLNHKSDFILEYNESTGKNLKRNDVDWSQSKVIFVAPSFTTYQREAIGFKDLPIELYEIKKYSNNTVSFNQILAKKSSESITTVSKANEKVEAVNKEIKVYTEEERKEAGSQEMQELYDKSPKTHPLKPNPNLLDSRRVRFAGLKNGPASSPTFFALRKNTIFVPLCFHN